jgi:hypothetical protein
LSPECRFFAKLVVGRFAAEFVAHLQRDAAHLRNLVDQMCGSRIVLL